MVNNNMVSLFPAIGATLLGLALGLAAGLSPTKGTTKRTVGVLGALAGGSGVVGWTQGAEEVGLLVAGLSAGFILGMAIGIVISGTLPRYMPSED